MGNAQMAALRTAERVDAVPIASQLKSAALAMHGDTAGAEATQLRFTRRCPVVSQARSLVEAVQGDAAAAEETQREFLENASRTLDIIPGVGHVKGAVHAALGDEARGAEASAEADASLRRVGAGAAAAAGAVGAMVHRTAEVVDEFLRRAAGPRPDGFDGATLICCAEGRTVCGVCLDEVPEGQPLCVLQCFHCFHPPCARKWWKESRCCAVCRAPVIRPAAQAEVAVPVVGVPVAGGDPEAE